MVSVFLYGVTFFTQKWVGRPGQRFFFFNKFLFLFLSNLQTQLLNSKK